MKTLSILVAITLVNLVAILSPYAPAVAMVIFFTIGLLFATANIQDDRREGDF